MNPYSYGSIFINEKQNDYLRDICFICIFVLPEEKNSDKLDKDCNSDKLDKDCLLT